MKRALLFMLVLAYVAPVQVSASFGLVPGVSAVGAGALPKTVRSLGHTGIQSRNGRTLVNRVLANLGLSASF